MGYVEWMKWRREISFDFESATGNGCDAWD